MGATCRRFSAEARLMYRRFCSRRQSTRFLQTLCRLLLSPWFLRHLLTRDARQCSPAPQPSRPSRPTEQQQTLRSRPTSRADPLDRPSRPTSPRARAQPLRHHWSVFFFTLVTGPRRSLSLKLSDTRVITGQLRPLVSRVSHCRFLSLWHGRWRFFLPGPISMSRATAP